MPPSAWPIVPSTSGVARVTDHHDLAAVARASWRPRHAPWSPADRSRRTRCSPRARGFGAHRARHAMRAEHDRARRRNVVQLVDEYRALRAAGRRRRTCCARPRGARRSARQTARARCSTIAIARSTPAQKSARIGEQDSFIGSASLPDDRHRCWRKLSRISSAAPTVSALSATLNAGNGSKRAASPRAERQVVVNQQEIDDLAQSQAIAEVAQRPAEDQAQCQAVDAIAAAPQQPDHQTPRQRVAKAVNR